jgi:polysaccharide biosynthesis protein PslH
MRILMIANYLPYPQNSGGRIRIYNLLRRVASQHEVSLVAFLESPEDADGISHLRQICAHVETANFQKSSRLSKVPGLLRFALQGKPPELMLLHSEELVNKIQQLVSMVDFDLVQIESVMGLYLDVIPRTGRFKSIEMFQNFTSQQYERFTNVEQRWDRKLRMWLNGVTMGYWEPRYAEKFDRCTAVSEADRQLLLKANPHLQVEVIPNGVDIEKYQPLSLPTEQTLPSLLFIGNMEYPPCVDAVVYFCQEIFPRIRQKIGAVEFWIVGRDPRPEVLQLNGNGVHVTGRVEDVIPYYQKGTVCVVPLRAGGGTRLKILEAMALGRPVVSTTIGCEGLGVVDGEHLFVADDPEQFAEKTVRLLLEKKLYEGIAINGRKLVEVEYDWNKVAEKLMQVYEKMVKG